MAIAVKDINAFLTAKGVKAACPRCGNTTWTVGGDPAPWSGFWGSNSKGGYSLDSPITEVLLVSCNTCGFVAPYKRSVIDQWLKERDNPK